MTGPKTKMVLQRLTEGSTSTGGITHVFSDLRTLNGTLLTSSLMSNFETDRYNKVTAESTHVFTINYPVGVTITPKDRLKNGDDFYNILFVRNPGNTNRHLELSLKLMDDGSGATS